MLDTSTTYRPGWAPKRAAVISSGVPDLGSTKMIDGVCRQTTGYTCAAASLVVVLIWVYYTAQLVLMGAEFTNVYACRWGSKRGQAVPMS